MDLSRCTGSRADQHGELCPVPVQFQQPGRTRDRHRGSVHVHRRRCDGSQPCGADDSPPAGVFIRSKGDTVRSTCREFLPHGDGRELHAQCAGFQERRREPVVRQRGLSVTAVHICRVPPRAHEFRKRVLHEREFRPRVHRRERFLPGEIEHADSRRQLRRDNRVQIQGVPFRRRLRGDLALEHAILDRPVLHRSLQ